MINNHSVISGITDWPALSSYWLHLFCVSHSLSSISPLIGIFLSVFYRCHLHVHLQLSFHLHFYASLWASSPPNLPHPGTELSLWNGGCLQMSQFVNDIFYGSCSGSIILCCIVDSVSAGMVTFRVLLTWFLQRCPSGLSHSSGIVDLRKNWSILWSLFEIKKMNVHIQFCLIM